MIEPIFAPSFNFGFVRLAYFILSSSTASRAMKRMIIFVFMLLNFCAPLFAIESYEKEVGSDSVEVFFRQSKIKLDPQFRNNGSRLESFSQRFKSLLNSPSSNVNIIRIISGASPEGTYKFNRYLSDNRANAVFDFLTSNKLVDSADIKIESRGIDWIGLTECVKSSNLAYKDEVLEILTLPEQTIKNGKVIDERRNRLRNLNGGKVWRELFDLYFANLRATKVVIGFDIQKALQLKKDTFTPLPNIAPELNITEPLGLIKPQPIQQKFTADNKERRSILMALKTNLLYDALLIPNIGVEFYAGKNWSVAGNWMYAWWKNDNVHNYWRTYGGDIEVRRWLGNKPLTGHHVGIYGQMLTYDFELGGRGYLGDKWTYGGGISYGYSKPLSRHFNLDFTIGIGFLRSKYKEYLPQDGHYVWQSTRLANWILPTKAEISLVWLIDKSFTQKKGGSQ